MKRATLNANDSKTVMGKGVTETLTNSANVLPTSKSVYEKTQEL